MATTKSTVVGIRLDHERRAWVEAEAARLGVSVRGLFEGMIDEARLGEEAQADLAIAGLGSAGAGQTADASAEGTLAAEPTEEPTQEPTPTVPPTPTEPPSRVNAQPSPPRFGIGSVAGVPEGLIREAVSLSTSLIEFGGRCATKRLNSCLLTRRWTNRSL